MRLNSKVVLIDESMVYILEKIRDVHQNGRQVFLFENGGSADISTILLRTMRKM